MTFYTSFNQLGSFHKVWKYILGNVWPRTHPNVYQPLKSVHFKTPVARSSFLSKSLSVSIQHQLNQNKVSWCCIENDNDFEKNEDRATGLLKWTDFSCWWGIFGLPINTDTVCHKYLLKTEVLENLNASSKKGSPNCVNMY